VHKRLFQSVSLLLLMLMMVPTVVLSVRCVACLHEETAEMSCCAGMHGVAMQMTQDGDQMQAAACCTDQAAERSLPASVQSLHVAMTAMVLHVVGVLEPRQTQHMLIARDEYPPGATPARDRLTRICTFLI